MSTLRVGIAALWMQANPSELHLGDWAYPAREAAPATGRGRRTLSPPLWRSFELRCQR